MAGSMQTDDRETTQIPSTLPAPTREDMEAFTPYLLNRISARYNKGVEDALKEIGVSVPQMRTLAVLSAYGPSTINELSILTVIKQSTLSRSLDAMVVAGLVERRNEGRDNRFRKITLTAAGRAAFDLGWPALHSARETMLGALSADERETLNGLLVRVLRDIRHHDF